MKDNAVFADRLRRINTRIEEERVHSLITEIALLQKKLAQTGGETADHTDEYEAVLQVLETYVSLSDPEEKETENVIRLLEMFRGRLAEEAGRNDEKNLSEMEADMKMLDALLGKDGLNSEFDIKHGRR